MGVRYNFWCDLTICYFFLGHRECRLQPSQRDLAMARDQLAENVEFDEDFRQALTELVRHADMVYPPRNIQEADDMYVELRTEMRAIIE